jgi:hypothetical protein
MRVSYIVAACDRRHDRTVMGARISAPDCTPLAL